MSLDIGSGNTGKGEVIVPAVPATVRVGTTPPPSASTPTQTSTGRNVLPSFNMMGMILFAVVVWSAAQNATGSMRKVMNLFLFTTLISILLYNNNFSSKIAPHIFKKGA